MGNLLYKVMAALAGILAARAGRSLLDALWARTKGGEPPRNPAAPDTTWGQAAAWAAASGVTAGLARMVATRTSAKAWEKTTGRLPANVQEVGQ